MFKYKTLLTAGATTFIAASLLSGCSNSDNIKERVEGEGFFSIEYVEETTGEIVNFVWDGKISCSENEKNYYIHSAIDDEGFVDPEEVLVSGGEAEASGETVNYTYVAIDDELTFASSEYVNLTPEEGNIIIFKDYPGRVQAKETSDRSEIKTVDATIVEGYIECSGWDSF